METAHTIRDIADLLVKYGSCRIGPPDGTPLTTKPPRILTRKEIGKMPIFALAQSWLPKGTRLHVACFSDDTTLLIAMPSKAKPHGPAFWQCAYDRERAK